jgi:hypothetical protein
MSVKWRLFGKGILEVGRAKGEGDGGNYDWSNLYACMKSRIIKPIKIGKRRDKREQ